MFEIGKKGTEKAPGVGSRDHQPSGTTTSAEPVKRMAPTPAREPAVIGPSIRIDGDVRGEENLLIEGEVKGTVHLKENSLLIGTQGRVKANVYAKTVEVEGLMEGDLFASDRVNVRQSAKVEGNITAPRISIDDGARFKGTIEMDPQAVEAAMGKPSRGSVSSLNPGQGGPSGPSGPSGPNGSSSSNEAASGGKKN